MIKGGNGCFEDKFSEISIKKTPTRTKKLYPSSLYLYDSNKENEPQNKLNLQHENDKLDRRNLSYPLAIEKSNSIADFQFSFMKETSSSLQKRTTTNASNMKKSQSSKNLSRHKRIISNNNSDDGPRRVLTTPNPIVPSNNPDSKIDLIPTSNDTRHVPIRTQSDTRNIPITNISDTRIISNPRNVSGTRNFSGTRNVSGTKNGPSTRNGSQPLPGNVFSRLYPSSKRTDPAKDVTKRMKQTSFSHSKHLNNSLSAKIENLRELFDLLYEKDASLFQLSTNNDTFLKQVINPDELNLSLLNIYERGEIIRMKELYYVPKSFRLVNIEEKNFGFDDSKGNYNIINHDHINYRYETLNTLGNGSFGTVIVSQDHKYSNLVAIKIIKNDINWSLQSIKEIKMLQLLKNHNENILKYYGHFNFRSHMCIVTELLSINLYSLLELINFKGLSLSIIKNISSQILNGLNYLHVSNIIHCDIKPENIMIKLPTNRNPGDFVIKLIDFGTSCFQNEIAHSYIQSRYYRAPEVILGASYNEKIDVWSFGCVICELFSGVPLFAGKSELEQIGLILELFGAPKSTTIIKYRNNLSKSLQKQKNQDLSHISSIPTANDKKIKKSLLHKIFDLNGKINLGLLNNFISINANALTTIKKQYKLSSRSLEFSLKTGSDEESRSFISFLNKIFVWDSSERATVAKLLEEPFLR